MLPDRAPSSTIAVNRHAQFKPHKDVGSGSGQSRSLIVGLGDYVGGETVVEGEPYDIRYLPLEFNGWKQRHWTLPFHGERYSIVWFTPHGCEGLAGINIVLEDNPYNFDDTKELNKEASDIEGTGWIATNPKGQLTNKILKSVEKANKKHKKNREGQHLH